jgi:sugar lactone lactonase YvrE
LNIELYEPLRCHTGERPIWDVQSGSLWWLDLFGRRIHRKRGREATRSWPVPTLLGSMALIDEARLIGALHHGFHLLDLEAGTCHLIGDPEPEVAGNMRLNDGKVDPRGRFVCGGADFMRTSPICGLYALDPDLSIRKLMGDIVLTNTIAWSPDGGILYVGDSPRSVIYRCAYDLETGAVGRREVFVRLDDGGIPDGAAVDTEGHLWVAQVYGRRILRYTPSGRLDRVVEFPVEAPTSVCFGGDDLDILFVTTKSEAPDGRLLDVEKGGGGVFTIEGLGVRGLPEPRFRMERPAASD